MTADPKEKFRFHQDNAPYDKSMKTIVKFNGLHFELLPHPLFIYYHLLLLFCRPQKGAPRKEICLKSKVIAETKAYFEKQRKIVLQKRH